MPTLSSGLLRTGLALKLSQIKLATRSYLRDRTNQATSTVTDYAIAAGLFAAASIFLIAASLVSAAALFRWIEVKYGLFQAFGAIGALLLMAAAICAALAVSSVKRAPPEFPSLTSRLRVAIAANPLHSDQNPTAPDNASAVPFAPSNTVRRIRIGPWHEQGGLSISAGLILAPPAGLGGRASSTAVQKIGARRVLEGDKHEALDALAKRAADVFNTSVAVITTIDEDREYFVGQSGKLPNAIIDDTGKLLPMDREHAICNYVVANEETLVVADIERDPRFADNETIEQWSMRFYAGAPLRAADGLIIGALCILNSEPRTLEDNDVALLETMAADVVATITTRDAEADTPVKTAPVASSATVGQVMPE